MYGNNEDEEVDKGGVDVDVDVGIDEEGGYEETEEW